MTVKDLLANMDSSEISEWMAFDLTNNQEWLTNHERQKELERSRKMSDDEKLAAFKKLLSGKHKK